MGRNFNRYCWRDIEGPTAARDAVFAIAGLAVVTAAD
jgi:hypothetical protein